MFAARRHLCRVATATAVVAVVAIAAFSRPAVASVILSDVADLGNFEALSADPGCSSVPIGPLCLHPASDDTSDMAPESAYGFFNGAPQFAVLNVAAPVSQLVTWWKSGLALLHPQTQPDCLERPPQSLL
jgi:hypothetical protein